MRMSMALTGILVAGGLAGGVATEAPALSLGAIQQAPPAQPAAAPPVSPANLILPPHLTGDLPSPPGRTLDPQGLPTLQDLAAASPTYTAPPPKRPRVRHR